MERTTEQVKKEYDDALNESYKRFNDAPSNLSWVEFENYMEPSHKRVSKLSRELRMLMIPEYEELPTYGDVMSLKSFIQNCKDGGFIDYDGTGNYVKDGKMANIEIIPSDVRYNTIRPDFDTIIWFNR